MNTTAMTECAPLWQETRSVNHRRRGRLGSAIALVAVFAASCGGDGKEDTTRASSSTTTTEAYAAPGPAVLLPDSHHTEVQQFGAPTFADYIRVSGPGPYLPKGAEVEVDCVATGPIEAAPSAKGMWYHMTGPEPYAGYYAAANTFENGDTDGPLSEQPAVDPNVPFCP